MSLRRKLVLEPPQGWQGLNLRELWQYRELVYILGWRDVKIRYKQTVLGAAWAVLQPAMLMVVFTMFFAGVGGINSGDTPYPLFVLCGLLPWTFFSAAVTSSGNSVVGSERLISKVYFPRLAVPFAAVGAAVVDAVVAFGLLIGVMVYYGVMPSSQVWALALVLPAILLTAAGLGTLLAALNVQFRDFRYVIPFMIQIGMFATPSIYRQLPTEPTGILAWVIWLNPLTALIAGFRAAMLGGPIDFIGIGIGALVGLVLFVVGCLYFRRAEERFADLI